MILEISSLIGLHTRVCVRAHATHTYVCACESRLPLAVTMEPVGLFKLLPSYYHDLVVLKGATERLVVWVCRICGHARFVCVCARMHMYSVYSLSKYVSSFFRVLCLDYLEKALYMKVFCRQNMAVFSFQPSFLFFF